MWIDKKPVHYFKTMHVPINVSKTAESSMHSFQCVKSLWLNLPKGIKDDWLGNQLFK